MGRRRRRAEKAGEADATKQAEEEALARVEEEDGAPVLLRLQHQSSSHG